MKEVVVLVHGGGGPEGGAAMAGEGAALGGAEGGEAKEIRERDEGFFLSDGEQVADGCGAQAVNRTKAGRMMATSMARS